MYRIHDLVTTSKTGEDGHLKLVSAFQMMQDCSELWFSSEPEFEAYMQENNMTQLLYSRQVDIIRIPKYKEKLTISTGVYECYGYYGFRNTVITDEQGLPCYATWSTGVCVNHSTGRLSKMDADVVSCMTFDKKYDMEYLDRKVIVPQGDFLDFEPVKVTLDDIDYNRHMNNAQYIRIACEYIPADFLIRRARVEYKRPAKQGDLLFPQMLRYEEKIYIVINGADGVFALIEFTA